MPTLQSIRKSIKSIESTKKITKAMKMVSAAKLRRAQDRALAARPYARVMGEVVEELASRVDASASKLLERKEIKSRLDVLVTSDRGLCGSLNTNLIRIVEDRFKANAKAGSPLKCSVLAIGRKGRDYFKRRGYPIEKEYINVLKSFDYSIAQEIGRELTALFVDGKYDEINIVYPEFKSMISQKPTLDPLFPVASPKSGEGTAGDYIYEPSQAEILDTLLRKHIEGRIYRALLETSASEHGARMAAMDSATNNSTEMIFSLTLKMNKARQASITKELMDIVNGAEALKS